MADPRKQVPENVAGSFFVDTTCIDCDTCRQLAPAVFADAGEYSFVHHQPIDTFQERDALRALLACPTGSIGTREANQAKAVMADFPLPLEGGVFYCGFTSPKSFGGSSYFIQHAEGNWLVDSPKFLPHLVRRFEAMGGLRYIFLTHQDDVADAERYAEAFGAERIIHILERDAQPDAEILIEGYAPRQMSPDFLVIPTPGHTAGHCVLLYRDTYLFTGDHMWWNREPGELGASRTYNWHSWEEQKESLARLLAYRFSWVLPGHGDRIKLPTNQMHQALETLVSRLNTKASR